MVSAARVAEVLRPWLGAQTLAQNDLCERAASLLAGFDCRANAFEALQAGLDRLIFLSLRACTGGDMRVLLDDGRMMRVRVDDIAVMADELAYLRFCTLPRTGWYCEKLRAYALSSESLSALRALYADFGAFSTPDESLVLARTIRACHPAFRWRAWLAPDAPRI